MDGVSGLTQPAIKPGKTFVYEFVARRPGTFMTGDGPFGSVEMGGMFSVVKVRQDQEPNDYKNPGWFKHPKGTKAFEYKQRLKEPSRSRIAGGQSMPRIQKPVVNVEVQVRKPGQHSNN